MGGNWCGWKLHLSCFCGSSARWIPCLCVCSGISDFLCLTLYSLVLVLLDCNTYRTIPQIFSWRQDVKYIGRDFILCYDFLPIWTLGGNLEKGSFPAGARCWLPSWWQQVVGGRREWAAGAALSRLQVPAAVRGSNGQGWYLGSSYPDRRHLCFLVSHLCLLHYLFSGRKCCSIPSLLKRWLCYLNSWWVMW